MRKHIPVRKAGISGFIIPLRFRDLADGYFDSFKVDAYTSVPADTESAKFGIIKDSIEKFFSVELNYPGFYIILKNWAEYLCEKSGSKECEISLTSKFIQRPFSGKFGDMDYIDLVFGASRDSSGNMKFIMKVAVEGFNACPCTMGYTSDILGIKREPDKGLFSVTHNQRTKVTATLSSAKPFTADFRKLADRLRSSMGGVLKEKGSDLAEAKIVIEAHRNPMLIEDTVREAALNVSKEPEIAADTDLCVEGTSLESIHHHDAYAMVKSRISELRLLL